MNKECGEILETPVHMVCPSLIEDYAILTENANNLVFRLDRNGDFCYVNKKFSFILDIPKDEVIGQPFERYIHTPDFCTIDKILKSREIIEFPEQLLPVELLNKEGLPIGYNFHIHFIQLNGEDVLQFFSLENKKSQDIEKQLSRVHGMATLGEMSGEIGHELNNFLLLLSGHAQLLPIHISKKDNKKLEKDISMILQQVDKMKILIDGLLDFSRNNNRRELSDINNIIFKTIQFLRPQNNYDNITFHSELKPGLPQIITCPNQIQQVLLNIINNSADAMGKRRGEGGKITISTMPGTKRKLKIVISDEGPGIPQDSLEKIFEPYYSTKARGNGLGLFICKKIITEHNGEIFAFTDSKYGKGAYITILLDGFQSLELEKLQH